ncbi:MAG: glycoside hydrolase family 31 protein, partial [Anaerolineae bacterium]
MALTPEPDTDLFERLRFGGQPVANPASVVVEGNARFTILTSRLLRLEWSSTGAFEDRGSYAFPTRYAAAPSFDVESRDDVLVIDAGALTLRRVRGSGRFTATNLSITFSAGDRPVTWTPGMPNPQNLRGTRRTLDVCEGDAALDQGLLSHAGWSLFDDSQAVLFNPEDGWVMPPRAHEVQDWYFFAYGHDYKGALAEYAQFGGPVPLIPRYVLGAWWSRYWAYSDQDLRELVGGFEQHDLPLDVLVVDMDWHTPHSWTGYTWNRDLFPDPPAFLRWVHDRGLRMTLNLHPAQGVQPFEEVYARFAEAMGVDPSSAEPIPFRITDKRFVKHYFELLHHPLEDDGVDFWWMDWQQGETSEMAGLDPLPWINHLHFADSARRGLRPIVYSRWGGLGNHRYPPGFSGDTWVGWDALRFQPYFTATASNVAYGWWGHDIGGHMGGATEPELYARWVQYGALSPMLRLHATKDPLAERRPWAFPQPVLEIARDAFHWRYQLVPYLYTMARAAHDTGVSLCRPMYYEYPEQDAAYAARYQYFFGDQMIAAPIVHPADPETGLASADVWVPPGTWIEYSTREIFTGPCWIRLVGDLNRVPMLVKAGAILPLAAPFGTPEPPQLASGTTDAIPRDRLCLAVFPGAEGRFRLYEDDGLTEAYRAGQCEWTEIATRQDGPDTWVVEVAPVEGHFDALPRERAYEIRLEGSRQPDAVLIDGVETAAWQYDAETLRTTVQVPRREKAQPIRVATRAAGGISALGEAHNRQVVLSDVRRVLAADAASGADEDALLEMALQGRPTGQSTGSTSHLDAIARLGGPLVSFLEFTTPEEAAQQLGRVIVGAPTAGPSFDLEVTWTWSGADGTERKAVSMQRVTESQILDAPFAFDGTVRSGRWTAEVEIAWRGETLRFAHQSKPLFPTICAWEVLVCDEQQEEPALERVLAGEEETGGRLPWKAYAQTADGLINVNEPHVVWLSREYGQALVSGARLVAYARVNVCSPDEREAVIRFAATDSTALYLNGREIESAPPGEGAELQGL